MVNKIISQVKITEKFAESEMDVLYKLEYLIVNRVVKFLVFELR